MTETKLHFHMVRPQHLLALRGRGEGEAMICMLTLLSSILLLIVELHQGRDGRATHPPTHVPGFGPKPTM